MSRQTRVGHDGGARSERASHCSKVVNLISTDELRLASIAVANQYERGLVPLI